MQNTWDCYGKAETIYPNYLSDLLTHQKMQKGVSNNVDKEKRTSAKTEQVRAKV